MVEAKASDRRGWSRLLARAVVWAALASAPGPERRQSAAWLDADPRWICADWFGNPTDLASAAEASPLEPAQPALTDLPSDRSRACRLVLDPGDNLGVYRGRPVLHSPRRYANAPAA